MSFYSFTSDNPNPKVIRRVQYECRTVDRFKNLLKLMQADSLSVSAKKRVVELPSDSAEYHLKSGFSLYQV